MEIGTREGAICRLGLSCQWDDEDREAVRSHNREYFERLKREYRVVSPADIPGFCESIQRLHDYGYSLSDIGAFIGVTRERVRQWFEQYDALTRVDEPHGGAPYRLWSDDLNCFVPVTDAELIEAANERKEAVRRRKRDRKRAEQVRALKEIYAAAGEVPRVGDDEVVEAIGWPGYHARLWGYPECSYVEAHDRLWAAAGFPHRPGRMWEENGRAR